MKAADGNPWTISCTENFDETVSFFKNIMGISMTAQGVPVTDTQFSRYAQFTLPNGAVLEVTEPKKEFRDLYRHPIYSISVEDVAAARNEMETRQVEFVSEIFHSDGFAWTYFRAPDGNIYQIQGPYLSKS